MQYHSANIYLIEVPDHISYGFTILGCPIHCPDCHSKWTWDKVIWPQQPLNPFSLSSTLSPHVSCLLFFGGEWEPDFLPTIKSLSEVTNLPIALYTGLHTIEALDQPWVQYLTYLKTEPFIKSQGGLRSSNTNQRLFELANGKIKRELHLNC